MKLKIDPEWVKAAARREEETGGECGAGILARDPTLPEEACPGHVASDHDAKVCRHCGAHIDSLRPPDDAG